MANICLGQESSSKWRFGTAISGGYIYNSGDFAKDLNKDNKDINNHGTCTWSVDVDYNRIQTSFYSQAGWGKSGGSINDFGLRAGYSVIDGNILQAAPLLGLGVMCLSNDLEDLKNLPAPSIGAVFNFKFYNNDKSKRNDIWMIRLHYNCSLPLYNGNIDTVHSIMLGIAVKGALR